MIKKRVVCVFTGNGKGKTTAGLGMVFRATGHGQKCAVIQFIKSDPSHWGEYRTAERLGVVWENFGHGFTWKQEDQQQSIEDYRSGWERVKELIGSHSYDLVMLDEISYGMSYGWLDTAEVVSWLQEHRQELPTMILTGRDMPEAVIGFADMVSEIQEIKHHFTDQQVAAQKGVEF
ncbi:MAG: cob(I)yrinic acid a,c-diamide adenosyltransferase [Spirochaetia bacterium]|nr:cob(I)yrinic acid a,c-diamide adenosyltransferase [Spirochaetia bacterium]MCF7941716.1 cob(I)yrinic acid a,c-diamide adenosyltransferase [Spirochaetia bacterium]